MISLNDLELSLDRKEAGATADFVSHAHSDHISSIKSSKSVIASDETAALLKTIHNRDIVRVQKVPSCIKMLDAGHMLGSKQIVIDDESTGKRIIYTGDFQMQKSRACNQLQVERADIVILDSTYPQKDLVFDERSETERDIQKWTERRLQEGIVLFGTYALGKTQEIIALLNEMSIVPVVNKKISNINKVYCASGVKLDYASAYDENSGHDELLKGNFVGIVEPHMLDQISVQLCSLYGKRVFTAVATGFSKMYNFKTDAQFPLSDHADFQQAKAYIDATGAKEVFTYGGSAAEFAWNLRSEGYSAEPFANLCYNKVRA